jgi:asparagine synthase (glutamine-hydrolysing)
MSEEFLALSGDAEAVRSLLAEHGGRTRDRLSAVLCQTGVTIFVRPGDDFLALPNDAGILVGRLFERDGEARPVHRLGEADARAAVASRGQSLIDHYWGNFVAILRTEEGLVVVRDPSGAVPAHFRDLGNVQLVCSHLELAEGLAPRPEVDELFLAQWLTHPFLRTARTGLCGWLEILPGTCQLASGQTIALWTPSRVISSSAPIIHFEEAVQLVRRTALATVGRLAEELLFPILELSGGLDSSIVAACLHAHQIGFTAANFATRSPDGDERAYARHVAAHLAIDLIELEEDEQPLDLDAPNRPSFRPALSPVLQPLDRAREKLTHAVACDAYLTGAGGDNIFCYIATAAPILDALHDQGICGFWHTLGEVAELGECTIFKAAHYAGRKMLTKPFRSYWPADNHFLSPAKSGPPDRHPWLDGMSQLPPGKAEHVEAIVRAHHFLEGRYCWGGEVRHPLLNQPLIEACISVPSWMWVKGGRNRAVARAAFQHLLPEVTINRRSKGRLESMCSKAFAANRRKLADLLLDGRLVDRRMLDRGLLEHYLLGSDPPRDDGYFRIFDLCSLELWLRSLEA